MHWTLCYPFVIWFLCLLEICDSQANYSIITSATKVRKRSIDFQCTLPKYPNDGRWEVVLGDGKPGEHIELTRAIKYSCNQGYKLSQTSPYKICDRYWNETKFPTCLQLCPPLYSTTTTTLKCTGVDEGKVDCSEATHGTFVTFDCKKYYEKPSRLSNKFECRYGKWRSSAVCEPICGQEIVDGYQLSYGSKNLTEIKYPWVVAIYKKNFGEFQNVCGGSIVSRKLVLTAAHCVTNDYGNTSPPDEFMIGVGKLFNEYHDKRDNFSEYYEVRKIIPHPNYNGELRRYGADLAFIVTKKLFKWSPVVQPVCIRDVPQFPLTIGSVGVIAGWGVAEGGKPSEVLRVLEIPYKDERKCVDELPDDFAEKYNLEGKICAGVYKRNTSVCNGDSGNGLMYKNEENRYYIHGIVSLGPTKEGSCDIDHNSLYTKVAHYYKFIEEEMSKNFEENCLLPQYPVNGKYIVENETDKIPGDIVSTSSTLIVQCEEGFTLVPDSSRLKCEDIEYMPKCVSAATVEEEFTSVKAHFDTDGIKVICTYASWAAYAGILPKNFDANLCTHVYYASAGISENGELRIYDERLEVNDGLYRNVTDMKIMNPKLKVLLSIGGSRAANDSLWTTLASNPSKMDTFIGSSSHIIRTNDFDGMNIDWHNPKESDKKLYASFIKKLRDEYDSEGWLLTASAGYDLKCTGYDVPEMNKSLDWVIVKTYDFYGHWSSYTGEHTALYPSSKENEWERKNLNVDAVAKNWIAAGLSKKKLIISVAFYGRTFELKDKKKHDIHSPIVGEGAGDGILKYDEICTRYRKNWNLVKNDEQKSVYKYSGNQWFSYDTPEAIRIKGTYVKDQGLLGVNVFPMDADDVLGKCGQKQILLKYLHFGLGHSNKNK